MKIKSLRSHYTSKDGGRSWVPKKAFKNEAEIRAVKLYDNKWFSYKCDTCDNLHVSKLSNKLDKVANVS